MPELPEVETMVRGLRPALVGQRDSVDRGARPVPAARVHDGGVGAPGGGASRVAAVGRRGKWVVHRSGRDAGIIVIQPRMTGGFWLVPPERPEHVRLMFTLDGIAGRRSGFATRDGWARSPGTRSRTRPRRPSRGRTVPMRSRSTADELAEPADEDAPGDQADVDGPEGAGRDRQHLRGRDPVPRPDPSRRGRRVEPDEGRGRPDPRGDRPVLEEAIAAEGSSFDAGYRTVLGLEGGFLAQNAVHGRKGEPCPRCGAADRQDVDRGLIGRPTYFCPNCQPAPVAGRRSGSSGRSGRDPVS